MSRYKHYLNHTVLHAARQRMEHIYRVFDSPVVFFSGGKDSLACLHLAREVAGTVDVVFRDEELLPDEVINFVDSYRQQPWVRMKWFALPTLEYMYIMGKVYPLARWQPDNLFRPMPSWAITDTEMYTQVTYDHRVAAEYPGRVAFTLGVRSDESLTRYRSVVNKLNENYITQPGHGEARGKYMMAKPIYDWSENDVFKYFHEQGIQYCPYYDQQMWAQRQLRISAPLHPETSKLFGALRAVSPDYYARLIAHVPEMQVQERYWKEMDRKKVAAADGVNFATIRQWILDNTTGDTQAVCLQFLQRTAVQAVRQPDKYPPAYVFEAFLSGRVQGGHIKHQLLPKGKP